MCPRACRRPKRDRTSRASMPNGRGLRSAHDAILRDLGWMPERRMEKNADARRPRPKDGPRADDCVDRTGPRATEVPGTGCQPCDGKAPTQGRPHRGQVAFLRRRPISRGHGLPPAVFGKGSPLGWISTTPAVPCGNGVPRVALPAAGFDRLPVRGVPHVDTKDARWFGRGVFDGVGAGGASPMFRGCQRGWPGGWHRWYVRSHR
jgi:hypothetical protein